MSDARAAHIVLDADPWQVEVIDSPAKLKTVMGGRGVGKTAGCSRNMLIKAAVETTDCEYAYFGPSYATAKKECKVIAKHRGLRPLIRQAVDQPFPMIEWRTGSRLYFRSLDGGGENALGFHLDGAVVDECHMVGEKLLDEVVRPQLAAKQGWLLLIGQHDEDGEDGWINKRFFLPGQGDNPRIRSWRIPSSLGRMFQSAEGKEELETIRQTTSDFVWRWQYLAEAVESQNKAFRNADIQRCRRDDIKTEERGDGTSTYAVGYDIGKVVDPSAEVVLKVKDREHATVVYSALRRLGEAHANQALHVAQLARVFGDAVVIIDATGTKGAAGGEEGDSYAKYYRENCPTARAFYLNTKSKQQAVQELQLAVEQGRLTISAGNDVLVSQLLRYRWNIKGSGLIEFAGPNGHDDDLVMALCMAWQAVVRNWTGDKSLGALGTLL